MSAMTGLHLKHLESAIKAIDPARRHMTVIASIEQPDRDSELILIDGIDLSDFRRNPIFLADHNHHQPIGHVPRLWIEHRREGKALMAEVELLPPGALAKADEVWAAIGEGPVLPHLVHRDPACGAHLDGASAAGAGHLNADPQDSSAPARSGWMRVTWMVRACLVLLPRCAK